MLPAHPRSSPWSLASYSGPCRRAPADRERGEIRHIVRSTRRNYIVLPLSAAGAGTKDPLWVALSIVVHVLLIGTPIALFARRAVQQSTTTSG